MQGIRNSSFPEALFNILEGVFKVVQTGTAVWEDVHPAVSVVNLSPLFGEAHYFFSLKLRSFAIMGLGLSTSPPAVGGGGLPRWWALSQVMGVGKFSTLMISGMTRSKNPAASRPSAFSGRPSTRMLLRRLLFSMSSTLSLRDYTSFSSFPKWTTFITI